jgi:hypothetical protein
MIISATKRGLLDAEYQNISSMDELLLLGSAPLGGINGTNEFLISIKYLINEGSAIC